MIIQTKNLFLLGKIWNSLGNLLDDFSPLEFKLSSGLYGLYCSVLQKVNPIADINYSFYYLELNIYITNIYLIKYFFLSVFLSISLVFDFDTSKDPEVDFFNKSVINDSLSKLSFFNLLFSASNWFIKALSY